MREKLFNYLSATISSHAGRFVLLALTLAIASSAIIESRGIKSETRVLDMLPAKDPAAKAYNDILKQFSSASQIIVGIKGQNREEMIDLLSRIGHHLDEITYTEQKSGKQRPFIKNSYLKADTAVLAKHGFMLTRKSDLENLAPLFSNLEAAPLLAAYNDFLEMEYIEDAGSLTEREKENNAINSLKGIKLWLDGLLVNDKNRVSYAERAGHTLALGEQYMFSEDDAMLIGMLVPSIAMDQMEEMLEGANALKTMVQKEAEKYPNLNVRLTGMAILGQEEMEVTKQDSGASTLISLVLILAIFIIAFRMWTAPLFAVINLLMGVLLTTLFIALVFGRFNLMTLMFAIILFGLGIDFAIHLNAAYTMARADGQGLKGALHTMYRNSGSGVITGALTTAVAFFAMAFSGLEVLIELGVVLGVGIIVTLVSTLTLLPALYVLHDRLGARLKKQSVAQRRKNGFNIPFLKKVGALQNRSFIAVLTVLAALGVTIWLGLVARGARFEGNMLEIEPPDMPSVLLHREILEKYEINPDFAMIKATSVDQARQIKDRLKRNRLVGRIDTISDYLPQKKSQQRRAPLVKQIREQAAAYLEPTVTTGLPGGSVAFEHPVYNKNAVSKKEAAQLLKEIDRLQLNVQEIGQMAFMGMQNRLKRYCDRLSSGKTPKQGQLAALGEKLSKLTDLPRRMAAYQKLYIPHLAQTLFEMASPTPVTLARLPSDLKSRYLDKSGHNLVTIYASVDLWDGNKMDLFNKATSHLDQTVTGTVVLMDRLIELIGTKGLRATVLALGAVFLLLLFDFRSLGYAVLGMVPLLLGFVWMVGIFVLIGHKFDVANVMAIPLILGIGVDDAVHILHAVKRHGVHQLPQILEQTGRALILTSLTTGIAFGAIAFAKHRGLAGMGLILTIGVATCLVTSIFVLPAICKLFIKPASKEKEGVK